MSGDELGSVSLTPALLAAHTTARLDADTGGQADLGRTQSTDRINLSVRYIFEREAKYIMRCDPDREISVGIHKCCTPES